MNFSISRVLTFALAIAVSAGEFSAVANAQNSNQDFPWRANSSASNRVRNNGKSDANFNTQSNVQTNVQSNVQTTAKSAKSSFTTPARDLTTIETIATPTPSFKSMPSVIYDDGKKFVRQGDTYVESPHVAAASVARQNYNAQNYTAQKYTAQMPAVKKSSWFQKTKDLTGRLNPFSKSLRSPTAYRSSDWKVPSFSKSLPSFSKKNDDPITFAAVTPLPAKTSVPSSLDNIQPMLATNVPSYSSPAASLPARDNQFTSALPTETKITSAVSGQFEEFTQEFSSSVEVTPPVSRQVSVFESKPQTTPQTTSRTTSRTASLSADNQFWSPRR